MKKQINACQDKVTKLNNLISHTSNNTTELQQAEAILDDLLEQEEVYWQQLSRVDWLTNGDRNTKFFHAKASDRRSNNCIKFLFNNSGQKVHLKDDIAHVVQDYFADMFTASDIDESALTTTLQCIPTLVTLEDNDSLTQIFAAAEVEAALRTMAADKSPGVDGMSAMFYQHNWSIVGDLVCQAVLSVLNDGADPTSLETTLHRLIGRNYFIR